MSKGLNFYVINDLNARTFEKFSCPTIEEALEMFKTLDEGYELPTLGVETSAGSLDLLHRFKGDNILVEDYLKLNENYSAELRAEKGEITRAAKLLVDTGFATHKYNHTIAPWAGVCSVKVVVPVIRDFVPDPYCEGKILKAGDGVPFVAINQVFVEGNGWIDYKDLLKNTEDFATDGVLKVEQVNVAYVKNDRLVGVNGQMDLSVGNFEAMSEKINKRYYISVSDPHNIRFDRGNFAVASFDDLPSAVKAWYDINDKVEFTPGVMDRDAGCCVFNGVDNNFESITYEQAAEMYGFEIDEPGTQNIEPVVTSLSANERSYTFRQSEEINKEAGLIGFLRADFGSGKEFWSTWNEFSPSLKTSEFSKEFNEVINALRFDEKYNGILKDRDSLSSYCWKNPDTAYNDGRNHYGIRIDTEDYSYLLRLNPNRGDYNLYCYCYDKESLDKHLEGAEKHANVDKLISDATKTSQVLEPEKKQKSAIEKEFDN